MAQFLLRFGLFEDLTVLFSRDFRLDDCLIVFFCLKSLTSLLPVSEVL